MAKNSPSQTKDKKKNTYLVFSIIILTLFIIAFALIYHVKVKSTKEVTTGVINMRNGPGITYDISQQIDQGSQYQVLEEKHDWKHIILDNGQSGWIPNWLANDSLANNEEEAKAGTGFIATVLSDQVNVYQDDSTNSQVIGQANDNEKYNILYQSGDMINIQYKDDIGWIPQNQIEITPGVISQAPGRQQTKEEKAATDAFLANYDASVTATAAGVHIRSQASNDSEIIYKGQIHEKFAYLGQDGAYYHVKAQDGTEGYLANWLAESDSTAMEDKAKSLANTSTIKGKTIVLDPGHGGSDPGAIRGDKQEKNVTLKTAQVVKGLLEDYGVNVLMTREDDTFVDLAPRADIYNQAQADAFISLHYDAAEETTVSGTTVYYYDDASIPLSENVQAQLMEKMPLASNGTRFGNFQVIRDSRPPAILIELGYISNPNDVKAFSQDEYYQKVAQSILNALIINYQE
ncbi:N-acetylmuramoyl-L-alanine amidase [Aerococcus urinae]|uniref:N-acetylmuramoyl-L-alanine amidase n=1 Tax=Aerococcus urinae TaxID=1376 RepID=UPI001E32875C|nr:N-acetylmuramoyl-L-alanine amidase [Aerococcus urinae]